MVARLLKWSLLDANQPHIWMKVLLLQGVQ